MTEPDTGRARSPSVQPQIAIPAADKGSQPHRASSSGRPDSLLHRGARLNRHPDAILGSQGNQGLQVNCLAADRAELPFPGESCDDQDAFHPGELLADAQSRTPAEWEI